MTTSSGTYVTGGGYHIAPSRGINAPPLEINCACRFWRLFKILKLSMALSGYILKYIYVRLIRLDCSWKWGLLLSPSLSWSENPLADIIYDNSNCHRGQKSISKRVQSIFINTFLSFINKSICSHIYDHGSTSSIAINLECFHCL